MTDQQYITEQYVGKDKVSDKIKDDIYKTLKENWNEKLGYVPQRPMALITVHNPHSSIIESIGYSEPSDLILDNFGAWFSAVFNPGGLIQKNLVSEGGSVSTFNVNTSTGFDGKFNTNGQHFLGCQFQVGRGGPVSRSDFELFEPFVIAPESNKFGITPGGWISGSQTVVIDGLLANVTTTDSIGECGIWAQWDNSSVGQRQVLLVHDIAGAAFASGQNVNVTYTWSIT
jgi:hypothetical protein